MANIQGKPINKPQGNAANRSSANSKKQKKIKEAEDRTKKAKATATSAAEKNKKAPISVPLTLTLEDKVNNAFDKMAVSFAYGNMGKKTNAVRYFADFINENVKPEEMGSVKSQISKRLKDDDFMYGSEFISLKGLKEFEPQMYEKRKVQKEFETHSSTLANKQEHRVLTGTPKGPSFIRVSEDKNVTPLDNKQLYQALVNGINNEDIKNIKGYSKDDLQKIIDYHNKLLDGTDKNGTAFESLYENSISDLKKFVSDDMSVDNDSYEKMMEFIKIFGTNSKGDLTPEGKAAYDKLMDLMAKQTQKDRIMKHKENVLKNPEKQAKNNAIAGVVGGLPNNTQKRENNQDNDYVIGVVDDNDKPKNNSQNNIKKDEDKDKGKDTEKNNNSKPIIPVFIGKQVTNDKPATTIKKEEKKDKKGFMGWLKKKWPWVAAAIVTAAFFIRSCVGGDGKPVTPTPTGGDENKPDTTIIAKPDTIKLDRKDIGNGFFLERSAGFKGEQGNIDFNNAENLNKTDLLTIKKSIVKGELDQSKFVRNESSKNKEDISIVEIGYKLRIAVQNFPKSKIAASIKNVFSGNKLSDKDKSNVYAAFNHIDDYGQLIGKDGQIIKGIPGEKEIAKERLGQGSAEYGTEGATFNNFTQVLKNHKDGLNK